VLSGKRPDIIDRTPPEYANLIIKYWDENPENRLDAKIINDKMENLLKDIYQSEDINYELKFIPITLEESRIWKFLKSGIREIIKKCKVLKEIIDKINIKKNNFQTKGIDLNKYPSLPLKQDEQSVSDNVFSIFEHDQ
ncbi:31858_t:CDS:1, partial [Racocetra persica]